MDEILTEILRRFRHRLPCPTCGDSRLYWDEKSQDVEICAACEHLYKFLAATRPTKKPDNVIQLYRSPNTGKLDDIPF